MLRRKNARRDVCFLRLSRRIRRAACAFPGKNTSRLLSASPWKTRPYRKDENHENNHEKGRQPEGTAAKEHRNGFRSPAFQKRHSLFQIRFRNRQAEKVRYRLSRIGKARRRPAAQALKHVARAETEAARYLIHDVPPRCIVTGFTLLRRLRLARGKRRSPGPARKKRQQALAERVHCGYIGVIRNAVSRERSLRGPSLRGV